MYFRSAVFLSCLLATVSMSACSVTVKHELSKNAIAQLNKVKEGASDTVTALKSIKDDVTEKMNGKDAGDFVEPTTAADYVVSVYMDSDSDDILALKESNTQTTFSTLDLDNLAMDEDDTIFLLVEDKSSDTLIDWWYQADNSEVRHVQLHPDASSQRLSGSISIYLK